MMFFEVVNDGVYPINTVVEMVNIGPAEPEDDEENEREPFIWATNGDDSAGHWYFRSTDLHPLGQEARDAWEALREMEREYRGNRSFPTRPFPF